MSKINETAGLLFSGGQDSASETSLTRDVEIGVHENGLPTTFVPGRNLIFLNYAAALGWRRGFSHLVAGMCEADFSGYPDCRKQTLDAQMKAISLGLDRCGSCPACELRAAGWAEYAGASQ